MKAALLLKPKEIQIVDLPLPEPKDGEVRIKLSKVGICGSDVHLFVGHRQLEKPTVLGHEGLGYIEKLGPNVNTLSIGQRVVIEPNIPCQNCKYCFQGNGHFCPNKRVIGITETGCFAEYVCIPAAFSWAIPNSISDENAVCIEPAAVAVSALFKSKAKPGDSIAVIGLGAIGLIITQLATSLGYLVYVTEKISEKVKLAKKMGAIAAFGSEETIAKVWVESEVQAVFECAGTAQTASLATAAAPRGSEIILIGLSEKEASFTPLKIAREGISIIPSIIYKQHTDFKRTIKLIESKKINPATIISSYCSLDTLQLAMSKAASGTENKVILRFDE
jgi:L-iditol 2-dehydrogenase